LAGDACLPCWGEGGDNPLCPSAVVWSTDSEVIEEGDYEMNVTLSVDVSGTIGLPLQDLLDFEYFDKMTNSIKMLTITQITTTIINNSTKFSLAYSDYLDSFMNPSLTITPKVFFLYTEDDTPNSQEIYYVKPTPLTIQISKKGATEEQLEFEKSKEKYVNASYTTGIITGSISVSVASAAALAGSSTSFLYLLRLFQILEILSNFEKTNVNFGPKLKITFEFIDNLEIPEIPFISKISPLNKNRDFGSSELLKTGLKGKLPEGDESMFVIYGQNFFLSLSLVVSWLLSNGLDFMGCGNSFIFKFFAFLHRVIFDLFYFDFQMICATEFITHSVHKKKKLKFWYSLITSMFVLFIITVDILRAFSRLGGRRIKKYREKDDENLKFDFQGKLMVAVYNEGMSEEAKSNYPYFLIMERVRFLLLQLVIAGLQLLNRTQATILMLLNLVYFGIFVYKNFKIEIFNCTIVKVKMIIQEISIMLALFVIWIFSMSEKSQFSTSNAYSQLEIVLIISIILAATSELFLVIYQGIKSLITKFRNRKIKGKLSKSQKRKKSKKAPNTANAVSWKRALPNGQKSRAKEVRTKSKLSMRFGSRGRIVSLRMGRMLGNRGDRKISKSSHFWSKKKMMNLEKKRLGSRIND
jgi:hypothetical protein